jgi:hypothetical protein
MGGARDVHGQVMSVGARPSWSSVAGFLSKTRRSARIGEVGEAES